MKVLNFDETNYNLAIVTLEYYRRRYFIRKKTDPSPYIVFKLLDLFKFLETYPEIFPPQVRDLLDNLTDEEKSALASIPFELQVGSPILESQKHCERIIKGFEKCLESDKKLFKYNLLEQRENLLFTCIFFYNIYWDHYAQGINSDLIEESIQDKERFNNLYLYRNKKQFREIVSIILDYYYGSRHDTNNFKNKREDSTKVRLDIGVNFYEINNHIYSRWMIRAMIKSIEEGDYPAQLGKEGELLSDLLKRKEDLNMGKRIKEQPDLFYESLQSLTKLDPDIYLPHKKSYRSNVKRFIRSIHTMFATTMNLEPTRFTSFQLRLYNQILILFDIDDFAKEKKAFNPNLNNIGVTERDVVSNRMSALLKDKKY